MTTTKTPRSAFEITLNWTEATSEFDGRKFSTFDEVDAFIAEHILPSASVDGGYCKSNWTIRHIPTGETWISRLDVLRSERDGRAHQSLIRHMALFIRNWLTVPRLRELARNLAGGEDKLAEADAEKRVWAARLGVRLESEAK